jgi:hypothetical protein
VGWHGASLWEITMRIEIALASLTLAGLISAPVAGADPPPCQADPSKGETCSRTVIVIQSPTFPDGRPIDDKFDILVPGVLDHGAWKSNQIPPDALPPPDVPPPAAPPPAPAEQSCHGRVIPADDFCPPA